jgi:hypothetical protein
MSLTMLTSGPGLKMSTRRKQTYRKTDLTRAIKAAEAAGIQNARFEVDQRGTITIIPGKSEELGPNEWDTLLRNDKAAP